MLDELENEVEMLQRHFEVLAHVLEEEPIGIVSLSSETGHPNHKIRYSLRVLEEDDLVEPTPRGAVTTDRAVDFLADHDVRIDDVIDRVEALHAEDELPAVGD